MTSETKEIQEKYFEAKLEKATNRTQDLLSKAIFNLLKSHAFLGHLIQMLDREVSLEIPTAGVCALNNRYRLIVNPFFYSDLKDEESIAILTHELYHLLNDHLKRRKNKEHKIWNVACDMAINCFIPNLPKFNRDEMKQKIMKEYNISEKEADAKLPKADKDGNCNTCLLPSDHNLPDKQASEFYYKKIMNDPEFQNLKNKFGKQKVTVTMGGSGEQMSKEEQEELKEKIKKGEVEFDFSGCDHEKWDSVGGQTSDILDEELKRMIREAKEKAPKSFGHLPSSMIEEILKFLTTKINWKARFRSWLQKATKVLRKNTRKRPSRRFGITFQGQNNDYKLNLVVVVDSSGSISNEDLKLFGGEINRMFNSKLADIRIVCGDTEIHDDYVLKKAMTPKDFKVSGRGGTCATAWLDYITKKCKPDAVVVLTDGYFEQVKKRPKFPILWALTIDGYKPKDFKEHICKFGEIVKLEREEKRNGKV